MERRAIFFNWTEATLVHEERSGGRERERKSERDRKREFIRIKLKKDSFAMTDNVRFNIVEDA